MMIFQLTTLFPAKIPGDEHGILPPMNLSDPTSPRDVVNIDDLVPPHIIDLISSLAEVQKIVERDEAQFEEWRKLEAYPKWFLTALQTLSLGEEFPTPLL